MTECLQKKLSSIFDKYLVWDVQGFNDEFEKETLEAVRDIASAISLDRDNALGWVKENLLKKSYAQAHGGYMTVAEINLEAELFCHAIQVFVNRMVLPKLVGSSPTEIEKQ